MFRFTIRDVIWLTLVVALILGWLIDRSLLANKIDQIYTAAIRLQQFTGGPINGYDIPPP